MIVDGSRFDALAKVLGAPRSRRHALQTLAGGTLGALLAAFGTHATGIDAAAPCPKGKQRCRKRCIPRRRCCTSATCPRGSGKICRRGRCVCPAATKPCGTRCISPSACCRACPSGQVCQAGSCCYATADALRAALAAGGPATIQLCPATTYLGTFEITRNVTVIGAGPTSTILDGDRAGTVVEVSTGVTAAELRGLQLTNGLGDGGGGITNGGDLVLRDCLVTDNGTFLFGGGIYAYDGTVILVNSIVSDNAAEEGGGLWVGQGGQLIALGTSRIAGNGAFRGGGIYAVETVTGPTVDLRDNTIVTGNSASPDFESGGGIWNDETDPAVIVFSGNVRVTGNTPGDCFNIACPG